MSDHAEQTATVSRANGDGSGGRLVASDGRTLPLKSVGLAADARGGLARVVLEQRFVNSYTETLRVSYLVPLPADAAVAAYTFRIGDRRITGEVDRIEAARERFETALLEGRSAALVEQARSNLFTQEIGNIPPGAEVVAEISIDQPLAWLDEGAWEWRFPTVVAPRYLGAEGRVDDAGRVTVDVAEIGVAAGASVALTVRDALPDGATATSPSHRLTVATAAGGVHVRLAGEPVALDRDVVVRWPAARPSPGLILDTGRPAAGRPHAGSAYGLLTVVPPAPESGAPALPRDLILLIDTSGSMTGGPLAQARAVARALVESLTEADQLELIHFSSQPHRWRRHPARATAALRQDAVRWIDTLAAEGSTEMRQALTEALRPLRDDAQRQVVLITDGLIGFESEIVATLARELPAGSRLHTVGVGPSVNRALTAPAARAGRGTEVVLGLDEDTRPHITRLLARMRAPILMDIKLSGPALLDHAPVGVPDVYAGAPLRLALKLRAEGGDVLVSGRTGAGAWEGHVAVDAVTAGEGNPAVVSLYGRESVEDLEVQRAAGARTVDRDIERIGLEFQIATRLTSWIAVSEEPAVDPTQPVRRERIHHAVPDGLSVEGLGLRQAHRVTMRMSLSAHAPDSIPLELHAPITRGGTTRFDAGVKSVMHGRLGRLLGRDRPPSSPHLIGRVVLRKDRELTVEVDLDASLDWKPEQAIVVWSDGTRVRAEIVAERTTAPGLVAAGLTVRLSLRLIADGPLEAPDRVALTTKDGPVMIIVRRA